MIWARRVPPGATGGSGAQANVSKLLRSRVTVGRASISGDAASVRAAAPAVTTAALPASRSVACQSLDGMCRIERHADTGCFEGAEQRDDFLDRALDADPDAGARPQPQLPESMRHFAAASIEFGVGHRTPGIDDGDRIWSSLYRVREQCRQRLQPRIGCARSIPVHDDALALGGIQQRQPRHGSVGVRDDAREQGLEAGRSFVGSWPPRRGRSRTRSSRGAPTRYDRGRVRGQPWRFRSRRRPGSTRRRRAARGPASRLKASCNVKMTWNKGFRLRSRCGAMASTSRPSGMSWCA